MASEMTRPDAMVALYEVSVYDASKQEPTHSILTTGAALAGTVDDATAWAEEHFDQDYEGEVYILVGRA